MTDSYIQIKIPMKIEQPSDLALIQFYKVGGSASLLELKMRLLADREEATEAVSRAHSVFETEQVVVEYFESLKLITFDEKNILTSARKVRNKFLHGHFPEAISILEEYLGREFASHVKFLNIKEMTPDETQKTFFEIANGQLEPMALEDATGSNSKIFGWLFEAYLNGALVEAEKLLINAINIVDRLSQEPLPKPTE